MGRLETINTLVADIGQSTDAIYALLVDKIPRGKSYTVQCRSNSVINRKISQCNDALQTCLNKLYALFPAELHTIHNSNRNTKLKSFSFALEDAFKRMKQDNKQSPQLEQNHKQIDACDTINYKFGFYPQFLEDNKYNSISGSALYKLPSSYEEYEYCYHGPKDFSDVDSIYSFASYCQAESKRRNKITVPSPYCQEISAYKAWILKKKNAWTNKGLMSEVRSELMLSDQPPSADPIEVLTSSNLTYRWIDNPTSLLELIEDVLAQPPASRYMCIDVEYYNEKEFKGCVPLIQVTTESGNYVIDPLSIDKKHMYELNRVTTAPDILKIMHGFRHDVLWCQEDFSIYFVNVFDTGEASKLLDTPHGHSLKNLVSVYLGINLNKEAQRSVWTRRPLSDNQLLYAVSDTYYLHRLFCILRHRLSQLNRTDLLSTPLKTVYVKSASTSENVFTNPPTNFEASACGSLYKLSPNGFKHAQLQSLVLGLALRYLYSYRMNIPYFLLGSNYVFVNMAFNLTVPPKVYNEEFTNMLINMINAVISEPKSCETQYTNQPFRLESRKRDMNDSTHMSVAKMIKFASDLNTKYLERDNGSVASDHVSEPDNQILNEVTVTVSRSNPADISTGSIIIDK